MSQQVMIQVHIAVAILLVGVACTDAVREGPRLRETTLAPAIAAADVGSAERGSPERVAGYFRLDRTHAAEMFYFYFQALMLLLLMLLGYAVPRPGSMLTACACDLQSRQNKSDDPLLLWLTGEMLG